MQFCWCSLSSLVSDFIYDEGIFLIKSIKGLIVVLKGQITLPWWSYIVALIIGGE